MLTQVPKGVSATMRIYQLCIIGIVSLIQSAYASSIDIHGYISQGFLYSNKYNYLADTDGGTFQFNEMGINFVNRASESSFVGLQISARDLGDIGNNEPYIDWAVADWRISDPIGIRFGKLKMPMGLYNETRDIDMLRTFVLLPSGVYLELLRDSWNGLKGFGIYGDFAKGSAGSFNYQMGIGTLEIDDNSGTSKMFNSAFNDPISNTHDFQVGQTFFIGGHWQIPFYELKLAATCLVTEWISKADISFFLPAIPQINPDTENPLGFPGCDDVNIDQEMDIVVDKVKNYTISASAEWNQIVLSAEYFYLHLDHIAKIPEYQYANESITGLKNYGGPQKSQDKLAGFYVSATRRLSERIELGGYYSWITSNADDKDGKKVAKRPGNHDYSVWLRDYCLSILIDLTNQWIFKIESHLMDGHSFLYYDDNPPPKNFAIPDGVDPKDYSYDDIVFPDRFWFMMAAKLSYSF